LRRCLFAAFFGRLFYDLINNLCVIVLHLMRKRIKIHSVVPLFFTWFEVFAVAVKLAKTETPRFTGWMGQANRNPLFFSWLDGF